MWWIAAGAASGAAMASKYTGILIPAAVLIALLVRRPLRPQLTKPGPYLACAVAVLMLLPVLIWNGDHDWLSFGFQLRHGLAGRARGTTVGRVLEMIGGQAGLVSPILFALMAAAVWRALRRPATDAHFLLAVVATFSFAFFMVSALRKPVEANWPALAYVAAIPLLASAAFGERGWRWFRAGWALAAALTLVIYAHAVTSVLPIPPTKDPIARGAGWAALARAVETARDATRSPGRRPLYAVHIGAERYQDASELAFHIHGQPPTVSLNLLGRPNQYDLWPGFAQRATPGDALVAALDDTEETPPTLQQLAPYFAQVRRGPGVEIRARRGVVARRRVWTLFGWQGSWPARSDPPG
jgi:4-amino-4-deoxy-L-arabinose transferase-like glycosyltransferase